MTPLQQCQYKCILVIDGWGFPGNLDWAVASGSWIIMYTYHKVGGLYRKLVPFTHFIPFNANNVTHAVEIAVSKVSPPKYDGISIETLNRVNVHDLK